MQICDDYWISSSKYIFLKNFPEIYHFPLILKTLRVQILLFHLHILWFVLLGVLVEAKRNNILFWNRKITTEERFIKILEFSINFSWVAKFFLIPLQIRRWEEWDFLRFKNNLPDFSPLFYQSHLLLILTIQIFLICLTVL